MACFPFAFVGFVAILYGVTSAPLDLDPLATLLRIKRQFGTQQQGNRRPEQNTGGQESQGFNINQGAGIVPNRRQSNVFSNGQNQGQLIGIGQQRPRAFNSNQGNIVTNNQQSPNGQTTRRPVANVINTEIMAFDPQLRQCMQRLCPTTNQYNPVCGDDNVTYTNRQKLLCVQQCNYRVQEVYVGSCYTTPNPMQ